MMLSVFLVPLRSLAAAFCTSCRWDNGVSATGDGIETGNIHLFEKNIIFSPLSLLICLNFSSALNIKQRLCMEVGRRCLYLLWWWKQPPHSCCHLAAVQHFTSWRLLWMLMTEVDSMACQFACHRHRNGMRHCAFGKWSPKEACSI